MSPSGSPGEKAGNRQYSKAQADVKPKVACSFCWFVLSLYPTLKGMTPRDAATYREHLKKVHGLREEMAP